MRFLPRLVSDIPARSSAVVALQGLNLSDNYRDGALEDSHNISVRRYPFFTTRTGREKLTGISQCESVFDWDSSRTVFVVRSGDTINLMINSNVIGTLSDPNPQFVVIHDKLIIWSDSDKKYYDGTAHALKNLGASSSGSGAVFTTDDITVTWDVDFRDLFKANDVVEISGCTVNTGNNKSAKITAVAAKKLTFQEDIFTAGSESATIKFERKIPNMEYICEYGSRLWGADGKTIYASALDDPTNFFDYSGTADDSWAVEVPSKGPFTGCYALGSSVIFFKEDKIYKVLGSYPAEYTLYAYEMEGTISQQSIVNINDTLYYMGPHGVMTYSGGAASNISFPLGEKRYLYSVAGTDGENYYLSCEDLNTNVQNFFVYSPKYGIWIREDNIKARAFTRIGSSLSFAADDGYVYQEDAYIQGEGPDANLPWSMTFKPFYESISSGSYSSSKIFSKKRYSKIIIRTELPAGSWMKVEVREDDGPWKEVKKVTGTESGLSRLVIPIGRCDKCQLRLSGEGVFTLMGMQKEFRIGSDK